MNNISLFLRSEFSLLQSDFFLLFFSPTCSLHVEENICSLKNRQKFAGMGGRPVVADPMHLPLLCQAVRDPFTSERTSGQLSSALHHSLWKVKDFCVTENILLCK